MPQIEKVAIEKHDGDITCMAYQNNQVFTGGADGKIKIWDNDLNLIKTLDAHEAYIYAMAINSNGKLYSSSCDGCVKFVSPPYDNSNVQELFRCDDAIQAMFCAEDILLTGDEKGVVTTWLNDKMLFKFNLVEEVKSLACEGSTIYTVRDLDVVISEVVSGKSGKYSTRAVMPGKSPLLLLGPTVANKRTYLAFADRTGKGICLVKNLPNTKFLPIWNLPDCHEMIVNSLCGTDTHLYSAGYDSKVKGWTDLAETKPKTLGEVDVGSCINAVCCSNSETVFVGSSDGVVRRAKFN